MRNAYLALFAIGIAFVTIGFSGQRTFIYIGLAFLLIAVIRLVRRTS